MVQGLNIGKNALIVNQAALSVVSNNIANMNTEGYSKQRVNLSAVYSKSGSSNYIQQAQTGGGVDLESITRYRDAFVDSYYRDSVSSKNYYETITDNGTLLESLANEFTDTGLSNYINSFFEAANNVSLYPTDVTMKTNFVQQAANLASELNSISTQLQATRTNLVGDVSNIATLSSCTAKTYTDEINQILQDLTKVNESAIYQYNTDVGVSSGLLDERDALLDKLSEYIPFTIQENTNGSVNVSLGSISLVGGSVQKGEFTISQGDENNPAIIGFKDFDGYVVSDNVKNEIGSKGKLGAVLTLGGDSTSEVTVKSLMDNLDTIAQEFTNQINAIQLKTESGPPEKVAAYYDSSSGELQRATDVIFTTNDGSTTVTAKNITINQAILDNPQLVATALVEYDSTTGTLVGSDEVSNNKIAQEMSDLRAKSITGLNGLTFEEFNTTITTDFGSKLNSAATNLETQESVYEAANEKRESTIGVNMEEELMDLIKYQRSYEASARVFSTSDEILETLVNLAR